MENSSCRIPHAPGFLWIFKMSLHKACSKLRETAEILPVIGHVQLRITASADHHSCGSPYLQNIALHLGICLSLWHTNAPSHEGFHDALLWVSFFRIWEYLLQLNNNVDSVYFIPELTLNTQKFHRVLVFCEYIFFVLMIMNINSIQKYNYIISSIVCSLFLYEVCCIRYWWYLSYLSFNIFAGRAHLKENFSQRWSSEILRSYIGRIAPPPYVRWVYNTYSAVTIRTNHQVLLA